MTARRLLLGDWHPWLRDPIDLLRASLLGVALGAPWEIVEWGRAEATEAPAR